MQKFIIEHLEPKVWKWCIIEYKHISGIVGKNNLIITNVKKCKELEKYAKVVKEPVTELDLKNICILDPEAKELLTPAAARNYDYFLFGGILGDYPPKKRTKKELTSRIENPHSYNIGKKQMSTDNAVYVVKKICDGTNFGDIKFADKIEVKLGKHDSTILPYRYAIALGKPLISEELIKYLKRKKGF